MIQRKQTLFMLLAVACGIACLCMPLGELVPQGMGVTDTIYNLWVKGGNGGYSYAVVPLFVLLILTIPVGIAAILLYHHRMAQAKLCAVNMFLIVAWYVYAVVKVTGVDGMSFRPCFAFCLPLIAEIFWFMARKGVISDEKLVRAADRIR